MWSYSGDPSSSEKDQVRFLIGDTDVDNPLMQDEEIAWLLEFESNPLYAAARAAETVSTLFTSEASVSADGMSFSGKELSTNFLELADRLRAMAKYHGRLGRPYVGGISWAERALDDAKDDLVKPHFRSHLHDNPKAGPTSENPLRPSQ